MSDVIIITPPERTVFIPDSPDRAVGTPAQQLRLDVTAIGPAGPVGPQGVVGPQGTASTVPGPQGIPGGYFSYSQDLPASVWTITHNLGIKPTGISVIDSAGTAYTVLDVRHLSANAFTLSFLSPFAGIAEFTY